MQAFLERLEQCHTTQETVYLRSLSESAKNPANFTIDFPELKKDFQLPGFCEAEIMNGFFSQPLRISAADMGMWAHYDTMDNVLIQVKGSKLVRLWSPV